MIDGERQTGIDSKDVSPIGSRFLVPGALLIIGLAMSVAAFLSVRHWEETQAHFDFETLSASHAAAIDNELTRNLAVLDALSGLYSVSQRVQRQQFDRFAANVAARHKDIQALAWAPRVNVAERAALQRQAEEDGLKDFNIQSIDDAGGSAMTQTESFPIYYIHPMENNEGLLGMDLIADPVYRGVLATACDSGHVAESPPVQLDLRPGDSFGNGVLLAEAVYRKDANLETVAGRRAGLDGFVLQIFRFGDLVEEALRESAVLGLDIRVAYGNDPDAQWWPYPQSSAASYSNGAGAPKLVTNASDDMYLKIPMTDLGKSWALIFSPGDRFWSHHPMWTSWAVLAAGLLLSLLATVVAWWSPWRSKHH